MRDQKSHSRLRVGVVGGGPVGVVLGQALAGAGHLLVGIHATSEANLERIDALLPSVPVQTIEEVLQAADLVLLAIPEAEIVASVAGWAQLGLFKPGQLLVHTAPGLGYSEVAAAAGPTIIPLALHPAMRFTGTSLDAARLREAYFAVTAPAIALPIGEALVLEMGGEPVVVAEADRASYAEAIGVAQSFSALVVNQAIGLLNDINLLPARELLGTLVRSSVEHALADGHQDINPNAVED